MYADIQAIRAEMARNRTKQADIATALGVSQQSVSRRLCGTVPLTWEEVDVIAATIGCSIDSITRKE